MPFRRAVLAPRPPPLRRAARAALRFAFGFAAGLIGLGAVAAAALYVRLAQGPLDVSGLAARLEPMIAAALDGARLELGAVALAFGAPGDARPGLVVEDLRLTDAAGAEILAAPRARVAFRPLDLLAGRARPSAVEIAGAEATIRREPDGRFRFGVGAVRDDGAALDWESVGAGGEGPLGALSEIALTDARLTYRDAVTGRTWRAENAALRIRREDGGLSGALSVAMPMGAHGETRLTAEGERLADGGARLRLRFSGASPRDLADQFPALDAFRILDAPLSGSAGAAIDGAGRLLTFEGRMEAGRGAILAPDRSVALDGAGFDFALDPETGRYDLRRAELRTRLGMLAAAGFLDLARDAEGRPTGVTAQIEIDDLSIADPALVSQPAAFDGGRVVGRATFDPLAIEIGEAHLARGALRLDVSGRAALGEAGWTGTIAATGRDLTAADLVALWPNGAAPGARTWIGRNVEGGTVDRFDLFARLGPGGPEAHLAFAFRDASAHYFRPLPPITGGRGWGTVTHESFTMTLAEGAVTAPGGGVVRLDGSSFHLPDIEDRRSLSEVTVTGEGPIAAVLEVLDSPPLGFPSKLAIDPRAVGGQARATARLRLPLLKSLRLAEIDVAVDATLADVSLSVPDLPRTLTAPSLALTATTERLSASGEGVFGEDPLRFAWTETFSPEGGAPGSRFEIETAVTPALARDFGVDPGGAFDGRAPTTAVIERWKGGRVAFDATADLGPAALAIDALGWRKEAGWKGSGRARGVMENGALRLDGLALTAPGLDAAGALSLDAGGRLRRLALDRFRFLDGTDAAVTVEARDGGFDARVTGRALDLRDLEDLGGDGGGRGGEAAPAPRLSVALDVGRLQLTDSIALAPARGEARRAAGGGFDGSVSGSLGGRAPVSVALSPDGAATRAALRSDDAGAVLREAGFFPGGLGGALALNARLPAGDAPIEGDARIDGMRVFRDPALQRLLAQADLPEAEERLRGEGIGFDRIDARFALEPGRVRLIDAAAVGPLIGLTASGEIDLARDRLALEGVFTPLYALNSALGAIPILGEILTGGRGEGVFGFTFALSGPADDPQVSVNPLSVLAPGILRRIFGAGDPGAPVARREPGLRD